jgi:diacylglycerol kinase family enzyme
MGSVQVPTAGVRAWGQVAAAIALVADRGYPEVVVAGVEDAGRLADALRPDADRCGVDLLVETGADGTAHHVVARRR